MTLPVSRGGADHSEDWLGSFPTFQVVTDIYIQMNLKRRCIVCYRPIRALAKRGAKGANGSVRLRGTAGALALLVGGAAFTNGVIGALPAGAVPPIPSQSNSSVIAAAKSAAAGGSI